MLRELYIKNVAVIDEAIIDFEKGFNVLTGETGAGKSILIDSINMVIGSRSSREIVRTGTERATVSATFEIRNEKVSQKLDELGATDEDGTIILSRQITADGKSTCRCNGVMMPLGSIREIGELLVDIHGQHDNQKIMNKGNHIDFLDAYGKYDDVKAKYQEVYFEYKRILKEMKKLLEDNAELARKSDLLAFQIEEIEKAQLKENEDTELEERRNFLANAEKIATGLESAYEELYGGEYQAAAIDLIMKAARELENISEYDKNLASYSERLNSAVAEIEDISGEIKRFFDRTDYSREELDNIELRLSEISNLKRKYGASVSDINAYLAKIKEEMDDYVGSGEKLEALTAEREQTEEKIEKISKELTERRKLAAKELEAKICKELFDLDMPNVKFVVSVENEAYTAQGADSVEFLISANIGEEPKPMNKIASGGELSRIMLAIKSVMSDGEASETMIFDEIDTGVSGRAAQKIAEKIAGFSDNCQVFAVTHLSQIAAMADAHFKISKESRDEKTYTRVELLDEQGRIEELGRIIGGVSVTETTLKSAAEMLAMAEKIKAAEKI